MKYLVVLVIVMAVIWLVRNNRRSAEPEKKDIPQPGPLGLPQDMIRCPVCSLHLPRADALPGRDGRLYCCADHGVRAGD